MSEPADLYAHAQHAAEDEHNAGLPPDDTSARAEYERQADEAWPSERDPFLSEPVLTDGCTCTLPTDGERGGHHHHADNGQVCWEDEGCDGDLTTVTGCAAPQTAAVLPTDQCRGCDYQTAPVGAPCPVCGSLDRANEVTLRWNRTVPQSFAEALLDTDWETLALSLPGLEAAMISRLREQAQFVRDHRVRDFVFDDNDPLDEADIADLTRRLALISDVLGRFGKSLTGVSKAALQEIAVDALETKLARVKVPLSEGGPTVVATRQTEIKTTFKDDRILAVLAEMAVVEHADDMLNEREDGTDVPEAEHAAFVRGLRTGTRYGVAAAVDMRSKGEWKITAVKGLAETLLARGSDRLAKIMKTAFDQTKDFTDEYKVTVEQPK